MRESEQKPTITKVINANQFKLFCKNKQMKFMVNGFNIVVKVAGKEHLKEISKLKARIKELENKAKNAK